MNKFKKFNEIQTMNKNRFNHDNKSQQQGVNSRIKEKSINGNGMMGRSKISDSKSGRHYDQRS